MAILRRCVANGAASGAALHLSLLLSLNSIVKVASFAPTSITSPAIGRSACTKTHRVSQQLFSKPEWLQDAMGDEFSGEDDSDSASTRENSSLQAGLAGFAVDESLGFVAIVVEDAEKDEDDVEDKRWVYSVVSSQDKTRLMSAEALTLVQLAGGIDVGAAVLPPEALIRIVRDELAEEEDEADEQSAEITQAKLVWVEAVPREISDAAPIDRPAVGHEEDTIKSSPEREERIKNDAGKLFVTIQKLPGLAEANEDAVRDAMTLHADADGGIDREAFTAILDTLRRGSDTANANDGSAGAEFRLQVSIVKANEDDGMRLVQVRCPSTFHALGLAMRYKVPVVVSKDCFAADRTGNVAISSGIGTASLLERFPAFRPQQQLLEDAQAVDGFIANMFYKENPPSFE